MGSKATLILETSNELYRVGEEQLEKIQSIHDVECSAFFITSFPRSLTRLMRVDVPAKYAEMVVRKRLRDSGEMDEAAEIITHWKRNHGKGLSELLFTAVPVSIYQQLQEEVSSHQHNIILYPLYSVLLQILQRRNQSKPRLAVVAHDRYIDYVIASNRRVIAANRYMAYADNEEALAGIWLSLAQEVKSLSESQHFQLDGIVCTHWMFAQKGITQSVKELAAQLNTKFEMVESRSYRLVDKRLDEDGPSHVPVEENEDDAEGEFELDESAIAEPETDSANIIEASLPSQCYQLTVFKSSAKLAEMAGYIGQRLFAPLLVLVVIITLVAGSYGYILQNGMLELRQQADLIQQEISAQPLLLTSRLPDYKPIIEFGDELKMMRGTKSFQQFINGFGAALPDIAIVEKLVITFPNNRVVVELIGRMDSGFQNAQRAHQTMLSNLRSLDYSIVEQQFSTDISVSRFKLKMEAAI